ncbi:hypothetical protein [Paraburkholderia sp. RL17-373-BIF-A]|uniref:hypothetical protein n=1 Tax=Paraburkholderia sp. RL17-373-BIF-A TaxID=3031629 RepID=UPI0038BD6D42
MKGQNFTNTMLCWNPRGDVCLIPWPDTTGESDAFERTSGACYTHIETAGFEQRKAHAFIAAMHLIIRDGCDPVTVHCALLGLDEYRDGLAPELVGQNV